MFDHHLIVVLLEVGNGRTSSETDVRFFLFCTLINKLAEAEGQEPETYETWIGEPFASCLVFCGNDLFGDNAVKCDILYTWIEEQEFDEDGNYIDSRIVAEPSEMEWQHYSL